MVVVVEVEEEINIRSAGEKAPPLCDLDILLSVFRHFT